MRVASFFSGIGGLDEGFRAAGFDVVWANENHLPTSTALKANHETLELNSASILELKGTDVPEVDGYIGGPPCQSWSVAGAHKGDSDPRGKTLWEYVRMIEEGFPSFFVLENVPGMTASTHRHSFIRLLGRLTGAGYNVSYGVLNAKNYAVPQDRKRLFIVGYRVDHQDYFSEPARHPKVVTIGDALSGLDPAAAVPVANSARGFDETAPLQANHYLDQDHYSYIYMSRQRVRPVDGLAFTVQASGNHAQLHPQAPPMEWIGQDAFRFAPGSEDLYRRISVREAARLQTFPDSFLIPYEKISDGYKMVGNAVPVNLARAVALQIKSDIGAATKGNKPKQRFAGGLSMFNRQRNIKPFVYSA